MTSTKSSSDFMVLRRRRGLALLLLLLATVAACCASPSAAQSSPSPSPPSPPSPSAAAAAGTAAQRSPAVRLPPQSPQARRPTGHGGGDFVFPDSQYRPRVSGARPSCARDAASYCEDGVEGYPTAHLNAVLDNTIGLREFFGNDTLPEPIGDRIGGETTLCGSQEKIIFPKMGQNVAGDWVFIVNTDANYQQGIRVEICNNEYSPCMFASDFPSGAGGTCKQKYIFRRLVAVGSRGDPEPDSFRMPSCCACFIDNAVASRALFRGNSSSTSPRRRRHNTTRGKRASFDEFKQNVNFSV